MSLFNKLGGMLGLNSDASTTTTTSTTTIQQRPIITETETQRLGAIVQPVVITEKDITVAVPATTSTLTTGTTSRIDLHDVQTEKKLETAALAEEKIHHLETKFIQPEITRDIYKTEVRRVQQPIHEERLLPLQEDSEVLPEKLIEINNNKGWSAAPLPTPSSQSDTTIERIERAPIIHERVHTRIIEDVQPIIYRDVYQPHHTVIRQPVHEVVYEAPTIVNSSVPLIETRSTGSSLLDKTGLKGLFSRASETVTTAAHKAEAEVRELRQTSTMTSTTETIKPLEMRAAVVPVAPAVLQVSEARVATQRVYSDMPMVDIAGLPSMKQPVQFSQGM